MANRLVEHLRKGAAGEGYFARLAAPASAGSRRSMMARLKGRPLARLFLGTTLAFACGVGLGVGVATVIAPEAATIRAMIMDPPGSGAQTRGGQGPADSPVVAVRLRQEGGKPGAPLAETAGPPVAVFQPVERKPAAEPPATPVVPGPKQSEPAAATAAPASAAEAEPVAPVETTARGEASAPAALPAPTLPEPHVNVPIGDVARTRTAAPVEPAAAPTEATADAMTDPAKNGADEAAAAPADTAVAALSPREPAEPIAPAAENDTPAAAEASVSRYQYEEKAPPVPLSELSVALGPAGLDGMPGSSASKDGAGDDAAAVTPPPRPAPKNLQFAALPMPRADAWIRNAIAMPDKPRGVVIALIIDDLGIDQKRSWAMIALPGPLTLSFIPYGYHLHAMTSAARKAGHEVMLHVPMEPMDPNIDPGPNALRTTLSVEENRQRLLWALTRVDGIVGLNNHMGSKFTKWPAGMEMVMQEVQAHGLLFVDSFTSSKSVGFQLARADGLPSAARDVFIDDDISRAGIAHSLQDLEKVARRRGFAVGIAHPHDLTREALKTWMVEVRARGIDFVPISYIIRQHMKLVGGG